jgi:thiol-disulfide isomerase/thioredoxin
MRASPIRYDRAVRALLALLLTVPVFADPPRYGWEPGDVLVMKGEFRSETLTRRGGAVQKLAFARGGTQVVTALSREGRRILLAVETRHDAARPTECMIDGRDVLAAERDRLETELPGRETDLAFLDLDDRGAGAPAALDPDLVSAVLGALGEVEVLPEGDEKTWRRAGAAGPVSWEGAFERTQDGASLTMSFRAREDRGARLLFDSARSSLRLRDGRPERIEGSASWTVSTKEGSERREMTWSMTSTGLDRMAAAEALDAASDAALPAAASEAWRTGEQDRALELWDRAAADGANRWAGPSKERAESARAERPMAGRTVGAWKASSWIGTSPEDKGWRVVYFFSTWAPACEEDLKSLAALARERGDVEVVAVASADALQTEDAVRVFVGKLDLPYAVALDDGSAATAYRVDEVPRVHVVDPEGRVRFQGRGDERELLAKLLDRLAPR